MHIVHARVTTKTTLQPMFEKTAGLYNFKGKVAESHRLFLFCADPFMEAKAIPWATVPSWDETARPTIEWLLTQTGPQDVLVFCDGRSRSWRGKLEELLKEMRHFSEMWVVYSPHRAWAAKSRSVLITARSSWSPLPSPERCCRFGTEHGGRE